MTAGQGKLFDVAATGNGRERIRVPARHNEPHSQAAAKKIRADGTAVTQVGKIIACLVQYDPHNRGMLREEICDKTGLSVNAACGRLREMVRTRVLEVIGERAARSGVLSNVYRLVKQKHESF